MSKTEEIEWNSVSTVTNGSGFYYSASHYETLLFTHDNTNDERMQSQYLTFRKFKTWRSVKGVKLKFWYGQVCIKSVYLGNDCQIEFFEGRENFDRLWQFKVFQIKWLQQKKKNATWFNKAQHLVHCIRIHFVRKNAIRADHGVKRTCGVQSGFRF